MVKNFCFEMELNNEAEKIKNNLENLLALPEKKKKEKLANITTMIDYYDGLSKTMEDRRIRIAQQTWSSIGFVTPAIGLLISIHFSFLIKLPLISILVLFAFFSILKIVEFNNQSVFKFPFNKLPISSNKWKWFYYGNENILKIQTNPFQNSGENIKFDQMNYLKGLNLFISNYHQENLDMEICDAVQQLYLLQVHNYYKNKFFTRLMNYERWLGNIIFFCLSVYLEIGVILLFYFPFVGNLFAFVW